MVLCQLAPYKVADACTAEGTDVYKRQAVCIPGYIAYVLVCVYGINGAKGFVQGFWQLLVILSVMNLMDRLLVESYWAVSYTHLDVYKRQEPVSGFGKGKYKFIGPKE